jgi:DNA-binding transcriptional LysR family regulator
VPTIVCTNMEAVREASLAGLGIAWVPDFLIADTLETGELVSVLRSEMVAGMFWLLWPPGKHSSPRLRAFLDFTARHLDDRNS